MSENKIIKCGKCGGKIESSSAIKGQNNTYLCGGVWSDKGCGRNVCFICGKKETRTEWREEEDCCGNPIMRERKVEMFNQKEEDENDPEMELRVYYCDEHKEEGLKSPLKWDYEKRQRIEEQKKQEIEEKLNSRGGLFYLIDPFARCVEWEQIKEKIPGIGTGSLNEDNYGCIHFQGQESGRNFWVLVPDTHPDLVSFKYKEKAQRGDGKEIEYNRWNLKKQFYLIEGIDNLAIEATCPDSHSSQYNVPDLWAKVVRLTDRIKIAPADSQGKPERNEPNNDKKENKPDNNQNKNIPVPNSFKEYFIKNNVKSIKLENNKLVIEYNGKQEKETKEINDQELKQIKSFTEKLGKSELFLSDLESISNTNSPNNKSNKGLYISLAVVGVLMVGIVAWLLRNKKVKKASK